MSIILRNVQIPLFIKVETNCLSNIQQILTEQHVQFSKPIIISEPHILAMGGNDVVHALGDPATILLSTNSIEEGDRIAQEIRLKNNDLVVSIGGGRVLDLGKYAATKARINYISIPTAPSNDGICSPVAVLKNEEGITESLSVNMPIGILADPKMMRGAPVETILSGIGDMISNFSAIADWKLAHASGKEGFDDFAASISFSAAQLIYESCRGVEVDIQSTEFLEKLVHGLILSGIAMNISGNSRPCSGSEHKISHALDAQFPGRSMHGLQVMYTTLLMTHLRGERIDDLVRFARSLNLPVTHEELGFTLDEMVTAWQMAPEMRADRYTLLEERAMNGSAISEFVQTYTAYVAQIS